MPLRLTRLAAVAVAAALTVALGLVAAPAATAAGRYSTLAEANIRSGPSTNSPAVWVAPKGTKLTIDCHVRGQSVNGTDIWNRIPAQGWISDSMLLTGSIDPVVPACPGATYNRQAAVNWALAHVNDGQRFETDCTWYVSQALWAGGLSTTTKWRPDSINPFDWASKKNPGPTKAAAHADYFKNAMKKSGYTKLVELDITDRTAAGAQLGDVILYDWDDRPDGKIDHAAIVTSIGSDGTVGVSQHTPARSYRQWNLNGDGAQLNSSRAYVLRILL